MCDRPELERTSARMSGGTVSVGVQFQPPAVEVDVHVKRMPFQVLSDLPHHPPPGAEPLQHWSAYRPEDLLRMLEVLEPPEYASPDDQLQV